MIFQLKLLHQGRITIQNSKYLFLFKNADHFNSEIQFSWSNLMFLTVMIACFKDSCQATSYRDVGYV